VKNEDTGTYPFSRADKFWAYLSHKVDEGVVQCPKMVYDEIVKGHDRLADWFQEREHRGLCIHPSQDVWDCLTQIGNFVVSEYKDRKSRSFLNGADAFVLAHAMAMGSDGIVVSHESTRKQGVIVKIPAVCAALNIEKINFSRMVNLMGDYKG
jgi:hypothetical protein